MELADFLRKATGGGDVNFLREGVRVPSQGLMELEVSEADWGEQTRTLR